MSSITEHYSPPAPATAQRPRTAGEHHADPRAATQVAGARRSRVTPIMGPANRAPGVPIMGVASHGPYLMGGADAGT